MRFSYFSFLVHLILNPLFFPFQTYQTCIPFFSDTSMPPTMSVSHSWCLVFPSILPYLTFSLNVFLLSFIPSLTPPYLLPYITPFSCIFLPQTLSRLPQHTLQPTTSPPFHLHNSSIFSFPHSFHHSFLPVISSFCLP